MLMFFAQSKTLLVSALLQRGQMLFMQAHSQPVGMALAGSRFLRCVMLFSCLTLGAVALLSRLFF